MDSCGFHTVGLYIFVILYNIVGTVYEPLGGFNSSPFLLKGLELLFDHSLNFKGIGLFGTLDALIG